MHSDVMHATLSASLPCDARLIVDTLGETRSTILLYGPPGVGKSTLACHLADAYARTGLICTCLGADPGTPAFGLPGVLSLAVREAHAWKVIAQEALCSLDAGRFRLPLILAMQRLLQHLPDNRGPLVVDSPGVVRAVAGREILAGLGQVLAPEHVLALAPAIDSIPLDAELRALNARIWHVTSPFAARQPGARQRARQRTQIWDAWLAKTSVHTFDLERLPVLGTPPPTDIPSAWSGRQVALLRRGRTLTIGEALALDGLRLTVRLPEMTQSPDALMIRDARRGADGLLASAEPFVSPQPVTLSPLPAPTTEHETAPLSGRCGPLDYVLVNGLFGDPLLHLRLRHTGRSLLFDLGDPDRLSVRLAHQVSDVFISHAHMDHIAGFQWLLRSRLGDFPACRLYGPPGLARHVAGFLNSFLWDRIADRGPVFVVAELHGEQLHRWRLQAGKAGMEKLDSIAAPGGLLRDEPGFRIRAIELDHHTPVLAFAFEPGQDIHVRRDRLQKSQLAPGPWLGELKAAILADQPDRLIPLPNGQQRSAGELASELLLIQPGKRLVYATDLADTPANRERLIAFARHAHTFFCESPFRIEDAENARRNGHLTTRACGEIAAAAEVGLLAPFHVSRRYQHRVAWVLGEIQDCFSRLLIPD